MLDLLSSLKEIKDQTPSEKMYILKVIAHQMLGAKWVFYRKIKHAGEEFKLFKERSLAEQMKATQAALRFTSRHAKKLYRTAYRGCLNDVKKFAMLRNEDFPALAEVQGDKEPPTLSEEQDEIIISWTPVKFLTPARTIREKGIATQPHSEGLVAKLFFKVIGFYAVPENWDKEKLTIYLRKITEKSTVHEVTTNLSALKDDLLQFSEMYTPFKFGKASLAKDRSSDEGVFDEDIGESFEDQIRSLYWHNFIYKGVEQFLLKYYLLLVASTDSEDAIRYLTQIFKPAIAKAIENTYIFEGSFETDNTKRRFRKPYQEFLEKKAKEPQKKKIKTKKGIFEVYNYNLNLLESRDFGIDITSPPAEDSEWGEFIDFDWMDGAAYRTEKGTLQPDPIPDKVKQFALVNILTTLIEVTQFKRRSRHKTLERFQKRVETDRELAEKRIEEIRRNGERQIRQMQRKVTKLRRMEQKETAEVYRRDIDIARKRIDEKCGNIERTTKEEITYQKQRLRHLFEQITSEDDLSEAVSAKNLLETVANMSPKADFMREFTKTVSERIQASYDKELEAFYKNIYDLLELSVQEKVIIIQSLEKSGEENGVRLTLTDEEKAENEKIVNLLKLKIRKGMPDIFKCNIVYLTKLIPLVDIFEISIDNESVKTLLSLKVQSKKIAKPINLKEGIIKALMVLNLVKYPVPRHSIIQEGREQMKEANQKINGALLSQLLSEVADARAEAEAQAEAEALNNSTSAGDDSELVSADASGEN